MRARIKEAAKVGIANASAPLVTIDQIVTGVVLISAILTFALLRSCGNGEAAKESVAHDMAVFRAESRVKALLRDPESAVFSGEQVRGSSETATVCGYVNSRNGFGGMSGPRRFVAAGSTFVEGDDDSTLNELWELHC